MRERLFLILFGTVCGSLLIGATYLAFPQVFARMSLSEGQKFESIDDVRKAMLKQAPTDRRADGSVSLRAIVQPNPSDLIIYELRPSITERFEHAMVTTNSFGMRNPEVPLEKPDGTYRIAVLGDSYTFGWGVEQEQPFPRLLEKELNQSGALEQRIEVLNFGVPGYATFQEVAAFQEKGSKFKPDMVVVYFISNDFGLPFFIRDLAGDDPMKLVSAPEFHSTKINPGEAEKEKKRQDLLQALDANRALITLKRYCAEQKIKMLLVIHPDSAEAKTRARLWATNKNAGKDRVKILEIGDDYRAMVEAGVVPQESLRVPRDHHPGWGAHKIIAAVLAKHLLPKIKRAHRDETLPEENS